MSKTSKFFSRELVGIYLKERFLVPFIALVLLFVVYIIITLGFGKTLELDNFYYASILQSNDGNSIFFVFIIFLITNLGLFVVYNISYDIEKSNPEINIKLFKIFSRLPGFLVFLLLSVHLFLLFNDAGSQFFFIISVLIFIGSILMSVFFIYSLLLAVKGNYKNIHNEIFALLVLFLFMIWTSSHALWFHYISRNKSNPENPALIIDIPDIPVLSDIQDKSKNTLNEPDSSGTKPVQEKKFVEFRFSYTENIIRDGSFGEILSKLVDALHGNDEDIEHTLLMGYTDPIGEDKINNTVALGRVLDVYSAIKEKMKDSPLLNKMVPIVLPRNKQCSEPYIQHIQENIQQEPQSGKSKKILECRSVLARLIPKIGSEIKIEKESTKLDPVSEKENNLPKFTLLDSIYFTTYTITTTGYGDIIPNSSYAKFITIILNIFELTFIVLVVNLFVTRHGCGYAGCKLEECPNKPGTDISKAGSSVGRPEF